MIIAAIAESGRARYEQGLACMILIWKAIVARTFKDIRLIGEADYLAADQEVAQPST